MTDRISKLAERAMKEDIFLPPVNLEPNPAYENYPEPIRVALNIRDYMEHIQIREIEGDLLTDAFRLDGLKVAGCAYRHTAHTSWQRFFHPHSDYMPNKTAFVDWNHYCANYRFIVNNGF